MLRTHAVPDVTKYCAASDGRITIENAKISGIMPAEFTLSGIWLCPDCRYILPARKTLFAYCTGIFRTASCIQTIDATSAIATAVSSSNPNRPMDELNTWFSRPGMPATMPPKMMIEMPLPIPFSVISSPSQTRNIEPAVRAASAVTVGSALLPVNPGVKWNAPVLPARLCRMTSCA